MWGLPFRAALLHAGMVRAVGCGASAHAGMGRVFGAWVSEKVTVEIAKQGAVKFVIACMGPIVLDAATVVLG